MYPVSITKSWLDPAASAGGATRRRHARKSSASSGRAQRAAGRQVRSLLAGLVGRGAQRPARVSSVESFDLARRVRLRAVVVRTVRRDGPLGDVLRCLLGMPSGQYFEHRRLHAGAAPPRCELETSWAPARTQTAASSAEE